MPFPKTETEINALLQLWKARMTTHKTQYGLTDVQIDQVSDDATMYALLIEASNALTEDTTEFYTYKQNMRSGNPLRDAGDFPTITLPAPTAAAGEYKPGIVKRNQELYNYLKAHPNRTPETLADLGIAVTTRQPIPVDDLEPTLTGDAMINDRVELTFNKQGQAAVRIQRRLAGGDWVSAGDPTASPFVDDTPSANGKPEKREYRAVYLKNNQPVGKYSRIITIYTTP